MKEEKFKQETKQENLKTTNVIETPYFPFSLLKVEDEQGNKSVRIVAGKAFMSNKVFKDEKEALNYLRYPKWELINNLICQTIIIMKEYEKSNQ